MMTEHSLSFFLFLLVILIPISPFAANHQHQHRPPPPPPAPPSPPPPPLPQQQLNNIIDALIGAGDFNNWANMLSSSDILMFPLSATLFVPSDDYLFPLSVPTSSTTAAAALDPFILPYHIVPQRLTFSQLTLFKPFSRLPTLLPSKSILITNTSLSNFTLDASQISYPDLYLTSAVAVHGIATPLNYSVYGGQGGGHVHSPPLPPPRPPSPPILDQPLWDGDMIGSDAGCLDGEFSFVLLIIPWMVWTIKIYGNPLGL